MKIPITLVLLFCTATASAQTYHLLRSVTGTGGGSHSSSTSYSMGSTVGEPGNGSGFSASYAGSGGFWSENPAILKASLKLFLEGSFNGGTGFMTRTLNTSGYLATRFPGRPIPAEAVDSIAIEIRNAAASPTAQKFRPAWLLTDGTIRDFSDTTANYVTFDILAGQYFLVVRHRNHLAIMSHDSMALTSTAPGTPYDFSTAQMQAYGTNPMTLVGTKYCLYAGDANTSGIVTAADANNVFGELNGTGYSANDINLSGIVTAADANTIFGNLNQASQVPQNVVAAPANPIGTDAVPEPKKQVKPAKSGR